MDTFKASAEFSALTNLGITRGGLAGINNGCGVLVRVEHGKVWLTRPGETTDVCLEAGESFRIDRDGLTLISTLGRAPFALVTLDPPVTVAPAAAKRGAGIFWRLWGLCARQSRPTTAAPWRRQTTLLHLGR